MRKPPPLKPGSTLGLVHVTRPAINDRVHTLIDRGTAYLRDSGFRVRMWPPYRSGAEKPRRAAEQLMRALESPDVDAVVALLGGRGSDALFPHLDLERIKAHPKIFCGYSNVTSLLVYLHVKCGIVTFDGPMVGEDFAEHPYVHAYTADNWYRVLTGEQIAFAPPERWTEQFMGNAAKDGSQERTQWTRHVGWHWLRQGHGTGRLMGGNLSKLAMLIERDTMPDLTDRILFWEEVFWEFGNPEKDSPPEHLPGLLQTLSEAPGFDGLSGMIIGRPAPADLVARIDFKGLVDTWLGEVSFPVVTDFDYGHTQPRLTLPLGVQAEMDSSDNSVKLLEPAVSI